MFRLDGALAIQQSLLIDRACVPLGNTGDVGHFLGLQICQHTNANFQSLGITLGQLPVNLAQQGRGKFLWTQALQGIQHGRLPKYLSQHRFFRHGRTHIVVAQAAASGLKPAGRIQVQLFLLLLFPGLTAFSGPFHFQFHGIHADLGLIGHTAAIDLPLHSTGQSADQFCGFLKVFDLLIIFSKIIFSGNGPQLIFHTVGRLLQQQPEAIRSKFLQEFIRVLGIPHLQHLHLQAGLFQNGNSPLGGVLACIVAVIDQHHLIGIAAEQIGAILRQGSAQGGHGTVKAVLMQGNGVHIALHQDQITKFAFLC